MTLRQPWITPSREDTPNRRVVRLTAWFGQPLSNWQCLLGWLLATCFFVGVAQFLGGPTSADAHSSTNATWLIAHGYLACAFPPPNAVVYQTTAPLYPLLAGMTSALAHLGSAMAFPTATQLGPHCSTSTSAVYEWSFHSKVLPTTLKFGYLGWISLSAGVVALLRSTDKGRCRREPCALLLIALTPPVYMCLLEYFHPQDLLALGLSIGGVSQFLRRRWAWAGASCWC